MHSAFVHDQFTARKKVFTILGAKFHIYDPGGNVIAFVKQKAFKLREDIRVYTDESMQQELLLIKARSILDFSTAYDILDATNGEKAGTLKRKGWKSLLRDEWIVMDAAGQDAGRIREESAVMATIRRFLPLGDIIPQTFLFEIGGQTAATAEQNFNPFVRKLFVNAAQDPQRRLDRRLLTAGVVLLLAVERTQE